MPRRRWPGYLAPTDGPIALNRESRQAAGLKLWLPTTPLRLRGGAKLIDLVGGNQVALTNNPVWTPDADMGIAPMYVSGSTTRAQITSLVPAPLYNDAFWIAVWCRPSAFATGNAFYTVFNMATSANTNQLTLDFGTFSTNQITVHTANTGGNVNLAFNITASTYVGQLTHLVACRNGTNLRLWVNGVLRATTAYVPTSDFVPAKFGLGSTAAGGSYFDGQIGDARLGIGDLSNADVWAMYDPATRWELYDAPKRRTMVLVPATSATNYSLSGPSTGTVGIASTNFSVHPDANYTGTITPSDGSGGGTFTPSSLSYSAESGIKTFTYTPASAGAKTISTTSSPALTDPSPLTYTAVAAATSYTLSGPSAGFVGSPTSNYTVTPNGPYTGTITPSDSGGGGSFTPSSLTFSNSAVAQTFTYTPASAGAFIISTTSSPSITDPSSLPLNVATAPGGVADPNIFYSPYTWRISGNTYAITNNNGAYLKLGFTGTGIAVKVDLSAYAGVSAASNAYPSIVWSIDGGAWSSPYLFTSSDTFKALASGLTNGSHTLFLYVSSVVPNPSYDRWTTPVCALKITGFTQSDGSTALAGTAAPTDLGSKRAVFYGDSISEWLDPHEGNYIPDVAAAFDAEYGQVGFSGTGWLVVGGSNAPVFHINGSTHSWDLYSSGQSRLVGGLLSPTPDYIFVNHGTNDRSQSDAGVQAAVTSFLAAIRTAAPTSKIFIIIPVGGYKRSAITTAVVAAKATDTNLYLLDLGTTYQVGLDNNGASYKSADGIHPVTAQHAVIGAKLAQAAQSQLGGSGGGTTIVRRGGRGRFGLL